MPLLLVRLYLVLLVPTLISACGRRSTNWLQQTAALSAETHACYPLADFELCIPHPGKGRVIVARSALSPTEITSALIKFTGVTTDKTPQAIGDQLYDVTQLFPKFIATRFNTLVNFSGPNCYNTALLASGGIGREQLRYISQDEFDLIIADQYEEVDASQAKFGDVLVYDARHSREHVALYLGHGLIFHKKGVMKGYGYRITAIDKAYDFEPGEWTESPIKMFLLPADTSTIKAERAFYRLKNPAKVQPLSPVTALVNTIEQAVLKAAPEWAIHKYIGILGESVTIRLKRDLESMGDGLGNQKGLLKVRLTSLHDQIFLSIDEALFRTPRGMTRATELRSQYCYDETSEFIPQLIAGLASMYRPDTRLTDDEKQAVLNGIKSHDRVSCNAPVADIVKAAIK